MPVSFASSSKESALKQKPSLTPRAKSSSKFVNYVPGVTMPK